MSRLYGKNFSPAYVENELRKLNQALNEKLRIYVFGGAVMAMNGFKDGTKDLDILTEDDRSQEILIRSLIKCNYHLLQIQDLTKPYQELSATTRENIDSFRWEIFVKYVAKKLALTQTMEQRAKRMYTGSLLTVLMLSKEDIFLLKGMTERDRDLEDMHILVQSGIDYNVILQECTGQSQSDIRGNIWEASLYEKLMELENKYGVRVPIMKELKKIAEDKMLISPIKRILQARSVSRDEILNALTSLKSEDVDYALEFLMKRKYVVQSQDGKFIWGKA